MARRCKLNGGRSCCPLGSAAELVASTSCPTHRDPHSGAFSVEKIVPKEFCAKDVNC